MENITNHSITYYTVETYALFHNIDKSILATNSFIEKFGYQFVCINLDILEKKFSALLSLPKDFKSEMSVHFQDSDITVSNEFCQALTNSHLFDHQIFENKQVIFLKEINDFDQEVIDNKQDIEVSIQHVVKLENFVKALVQQLRLFKNGDIDCPTQFQITKKERLIAYKSTRPISKSYGNTVYKLTENEIENIARTYTESFNSNTLTELAISNFNLSYNIQDIKTKYITLMTSLESLFNQGRDQITHIVSRHLSLVISNSEKEFEYNYSRIKKLYKIRSAIVHGDTTNENLTKATEDLQNLVRQAINYCLTHDYNKKQLFDKLNKFGFGK